MKSVGTDAPVVTNDQGGMQSAVEYRFDLIDTSAIFALAEVLAIGAKKYAPDNWRKISPNDHLNHMLIHAMAWKAGDTQDDHLGHALTRAMMLYATAKEDNPHEK